MLASWGINKITLNSQTLFLEKGRTVGVEWEGAENSKLPIMIALSRPAPTLKLSRTYRELLNRTREIPVIEEMKFESGTMPKDQITK